MGMTHLCRVSNQLSHYLEPNMGGVLAEIFKQMHNEITYKKTNAQINTNIMPESFLINNRTIVMVIDHTEPPNLVSRGIKRSVIGFLSDLLKKKKAEISPN